MAPGLTSHHNGIQFLPLDTVVLEGLGPSLLNQMAVPEGSIADLGGSVCEKGHVWGVGPRRFQKECLSIPGGRKCEPPVDVKGAIQSESEGGFEMRNRMCQV